MLAAGVLVVFGAFGRAVTTSLDTVVGSLNPTSSAVTETPADLGVTGTTMKTDLESMGFQFADSDFSDQGRIMGECRQRVQVVELVGSPERVSSVTLATTLLNDPKQNSAQVDAMVSLLQETVPGWDGKAWLTASIPIAMDRGLVEMQAGSTHVTLKSFNVRDMRPLLLIIQSK